MKCSHVPAPLWNEADRIRALGAYRILDTPREEEFEDIVELAAQACNAPIALISFIDTDRQWFKAGVGVNMRETPLNVSICAHALQHSGLFIVPDTTLDPRFADNPLVKGDPYIRFYAGAPLETPEGLPMGTVCVLDYKPRTLSAKEAFTLNALAGQVMTQLELRRSLADTRAALKDKTRSEERLALALNSSGIIGVWDWDIVHDRVFADTRFVAAFGGQPHWTTDGATSEEYLRAIHPDDLDRVKAAIDRAVRTRDVFKEEYRLVQRDGGSRWIEGRGRCQFDDSGRPVRFPGVAIDINERKVVADAARDSAERFRFLAEAMPQKIFTAKATGEVDFFNRQWTEFTGLSFEQIRDWGWTQFIHPDDVEENVRRWKECLAEGKPLEFEHRFRRKDGVYRWHLTRATPMRSEAGEVTMWIGSNTDIDDQRRVNETLERTVMERTAKMQASIDELEAFSYSISHDMRAPLRAMLGFAEILKDDYGPALDDQGRHYLDRIGTATRRMDALIRDVLTFSRVSRLDLVLEPIDIDRLIQEVVSSYPNLHESVFDITIASPLPKVMANEAALSQCVSNILGNAAKFVRPGQKPRVRVWADRRSSRVRIWFADEGIGIAPENFARIFEIFHRIDRAHDGTGIGLAVVKKAVEKMNGNVGLESELGKGTSFWLDLQAV